MTIHLGEAQTKKDVEMTMPVLQILSKVGSYLSSPGVEVVQTSLRKNTYEMIWTIAKSFKDISIYKSLFESYPMANEIEETLRVFYSSVSEKTLSISIDDLEIIAGFYGIFYFGSSAILSQIETLSVDQLKHLSRKYNFKRTFVGLRKKEAYPFQSIIQEAIKKRISEPEYPVEW